MINGSLYNDGHVYPILVDNKQVVNYISDDVFFKTKFKINFITYICIRKLKNEFLKLHHNNLIQKNGKSR